VPPIPVFCATYTGASCATGANPVENYPEVRAFGLERMATEPPVLLDLNENEMGMEKNLITASVFDS
jgi:hypothetical protein